MSRTSTSATLSWRTAAIPAKPPPTTTTFGRRRELTGDGAVGTGAVALMVRSSQGRRSSSVRVDVDPPQRRDPRPGALPRGWLASGHDLQRTPRRRLREPASERHLL